MQAAILAAMLLQHGQHAAGKTQPSEAEGFPMRPTADRTAREAAAQLAMKNAIRRLADYVAKNDKTWQAARAELALESIRTIKADIQLRALHSMRANAEALDWGAEAAKLFSASATSHSEKWEEATRRANLAANHGVSAALSLPASKLLITPEPAAEDRADLQANATDMSAVVFGLMERDIKKSTGKGLVGDDKERAEAISMVTVQAELAWQKAWDELEQKTLQASAATALLKKAREQGESNGVSLTGRVYSQQVASIMAINSEAEEAARQAKIAAKNKALDKVFADTAVDNFKWMVKRSALIPVD